MVSELCCFKLYSIPGANHPDPGLPLEVTIWGREHFGCSGNLNWHWSRATFSETEAVLTGEPGGALLSKSEGMSGVGIKRAEKYHMVNDKNSPIHLFTSDRDLNHFSKENDRVEQLFAARSSCQPKMPRQKGVENQQQPLCNWFTGAQEDLWQAGLRRVHFPAFFLSF